MGIRFHNRSNINRYAIPIGKKTVRLDATRRKALLSRRAFLLGGGSALALSAATGVLTGYRWARGSLTRDLAARRAAAGAVTVAPGSPSGSASAASQPANSNPGPNSMPEAGTAAQPVMFGGAPEVPALAIIVLNRMGFGARPGDLEAYGRLGANGRARLKAYVEMQLAPESIDDSECDAILAAQDWPTLKKPLTQLWDDHFDKGRHCWPPLRESGRATLVRAVYSKRQLVEVLADHWHNHFNVSGPHPNVAPLFVHYDRDVIRQHLLGNFRAMLEAVAQSPAMLFYLDNQVNTGRNPNENYARELLELHTLGAENYLGIRAADDPAIFDAAGQRLGFIEADIPAVAACLAGWRVNEHGTFAFSDKGRSADTKTMLGYTIAGGRGVEEGRDLLDILATHPGTARFICRKLCRRLIADEPPPRIVDEAAKVFLANRAAPDQLKQVVRVILLSREFAGTWGEKMKRPFEYAMSVLRATGADFAADPTFVHAFNSMGQGLFAWDAPDGYPDTRKAWCGVMTVMKRWQFAHFALEWRVGGKGNGRKRLRLPIEEQMPGELRTAEKIVDFWSVRLLGRQMPANERVPLVEFMAGGGNAGALLDDGAIGERLRPMVELLLMSPAFQWR